MKKKKLDPKMCRTEVPTPGLRGFYYHQCTKPLWKDGYCKVHHPESVAARQKKSEDNYKKRSPYEALKRVHETLAEVTKQRDSLWEYLDRNFPQVALACREAPAVKKPQS